jgi:hypothetical protein
MHSRILPTNPSDDYDDDEKQDFTCDEDGLSVLCVPCVIFAVIYFLPWDTLQKVRKLSCVAHWDEDLIVPLSLSQPQKTI